MANHATAHFKAPVDRTQLAAQFASVNAQRFHNLFTITEIEVDGVVEWAFEPKYPGLIDFPFGYWLHDDAMTLEWAHSGFDVIWWVHEYIVTCALTALAVPVEIKDEGIGDDEVMPPDYFQKYPHCSDWIKGIFRFSPIGAPKITDMVPEPYATVFG